MGGAHIDVTALQRNAYFFLEILNVSHVLQSLLAGTKFGCRCFFTFLGLKKLSVQKGTFLQKATFLSSVFQKGTFLTKKYVFRQIFDPEVLKNRPPDRFWTPDNALR